MSDADGLFVVWLALCTVLFIVADRGARE